jgi:hypothetical protein
MAKGFNLGSTEVLILGGAALFLIYKSDILQNVGQGLGSGISNIGSGIGNIGSGLGSGFSGIGAGFQGLGEGLGSGLSVGLGGIGLGFKGLGEGAGQSLSYAGQGFMNLQTEVGAGIFQIGQGIGQIGSGFGDFERSIGNFLQELGNVNIGLKTPLGSATFSTGGSQNITGTPTAPISLEKSTSVDSKQTPASSQKVGTSGGRSTSGSKSATTSIVPQALISGGTYNLKTGVYTNSAGQGFSYAKPPAGAIINF